MMIVTSKGSICPTKRGTLLIRLILRPEESIIYPTLTDAKLEELHRMVEHFGNKTFMMNKTQGFEQLVQQNYFNAEEESLF